jgi:hypothetical protein
MRTKVERHNESATGVVNHPALAGILQRSASGAASPSVAPPTVDQVLASPGRPLEAGTRAAMESRFGHDFSRVRIHTDARAAESACEVNALAYTFGNHIVFGSGQFAPGSDAGRRLVAHELTHVVQQSGRDQLASRPVLGPADDAFEREADRNAGQVAAAGGVRLAEAGHAPVSIQRQPAAETPDLRRRRLDAASRLRISIGQFRSALGGGLQWNFERITAQGNQMGVGNATVVEPMASRQARLTQLMNDLVQFTIVLESGPVPAAWLNPQISMPPSTFQGAAMGGGTQTSFGNGAEWEDPLHFFVYWQIGRGADVGVMIINLNYIPDPPQAGRVAAIPRVAMPTGTSAGIWIVVPDADTRPMDYHRLRSDENWPAGNTIYEIWHDSLGYYYLHRGQKHYLPGRPGF